MSTGRNPSSGSSLSLEGNKSSSSWRRGPSRGSSLPVITLRSPLLRPHRTTCCLLNGPCFFILSYLQFILDESTYLSKQSPDLSSCMKLSLLPQVELARHPWPHLSVCRVLTAQNSVWSLAITSYKAWPPQGPNYIYPLTSLTLGSQPTNITECHPCTQHYSRCWRFNREKTDGSPPSRRLLRRQLQTWNTQDKGMIFRHVKCQADWSTSWNPDCWKKY